MHESKEKVTFSYWWINFFETGELAREGPKSSKTVKEFNFRFHVMKGRPLYHG